MNLGDVLYILECQHVMPGLINETEVMCHNCNEKKKVTAIHVYEWKAVCRNSKCSFGKWCGLAKQLAEYFANAHVRRNVGHECQVLYLQNPVALKQQERL
jgi:hypothetical protein